MGKYNLPIGVCKDLFIKMTNFGCAHQNGRLSDSQYKAEVYALKSVCTSDENRYITDLFW